MKELTESKIQLALENERSTMRRQTLLKRLWRLQQARAAAEEAEDSARSARSKPALATLSA